MEIEIHDSEEFSEDKKNIKILPLEEESQNEDEAESSISENEYDEDLKQALPVDASKYESIIEGILFAMGESVEIEAIAKALNIAEEDVVHTVECLASKYENEGRGVRIIKLEHAYQMSTSSDIYEYLIRIAKQPKKNVLTDVLLETLSIIAYKQPITKSEIEKIRGVSCDHAVSKLIEYKLVTELGRLDAPGRPMLFGTTEDFLRSFGISSIEDLPVLSTVQVEEFKQQAEEEIDQALKENAEEQIE